MAWAFEVQLRWEAPLRSATLGCKLFCDCVWQKHVVWPRGERAYWEVREPCVATTPIHLWGWQSAAMTASEQTFRYHVLSPPLCQIERGEAPPRAIREAHLHLATQLALSFQCHLTSQYHIVRIPCAKNLYPPGFKRSLLLGWGGKIPGDREEIAIQEVTLQEAPCQAISRTPMMGIPVFSHPLTIAQDDEFTTPIQHLRLESYGVAELCWVTSWLSPEPRELQRIGSHLKDALAASGAMICQEGRFSLYAKDPQGRHIGILHLSTPAHVAAAVEWLDKLFKHSPLGARKAPSPRRELYVLKTQEVYLLGWQAMPPYPRDPHTAGLMAPSSKALAALPLRWRWREQWELRGLSGDIVEGLLQTGRVDLFEKMVQFNPKISFHVWGELLVRWPRALRRQGVTDSTLKPERYLAIAALHGMGRCSRDGLFALLQRAAQYPELPVAQLLEDNLQIKPLSLQKLRAQLPALLAQIIPPKHPEWRVRERYWMGKLMHPLRGRIDGKSVRSELYRHFSNDPPTPLDRCPFPAPSYSHPKKLPHRRKKSTHTSNR